MILGSERGIPGEPAGQQTAGQGNPDDDADVFFRRFSEKQISGPLPEHVEDNLDGIHIRILDGLQCFLDLLDTDSQIQNLPSSLSLSKSSNISGL
jgi:hypothetical protein